MNENSNDNFDRPTAPISSSTPQFFNDAMAANMQPQTSETKKKSPLMIIIIAAGAIIAVVAAIILIISLTKNQNINNFEDNKQAGEMDTKAIFDKNAPIPAKGEGGYGYINPQNGEWVLDAKYEEAGQFYGNYASVTYSEKKAIINRKGEEKVTAKYTDEISYHIDGNVWIKYFTVEHQFVVQHYVSAASNIQLLCVPAICHILKVLSALPEARCSPTA